MPRSQKVDFQDESSPHDTAPRGRFIWGLFFFVSIVTLALLLVQIGAASAQTIAHTAPPTNSDTSAFPFGVSPDVSAHAAYLLDADTGLVLYSKNQDERLPQASCTKVMTALIAIERMPLDHVITAGGDAHALVNPDSSYMGLDAGEKLTLRDLLYGLVLPSGNDAAVAIADGVAGSVTAFVALMNERAQQLGLTNTHFENPHGLDADGHYTSARDLATLAAVALRNPTFRQIVSARRYNIPATSDHKAYHLVSGDDLLRGALSPYPGAIGVKPGYTGPAGFCMAFAAIRHGHLIVGAVLRDPSWRIRIVDMRTLLDWGFEQEGVAAAPTPTPWTNPPNV
ncbi:MAG TPA: D-alanyl-D-alanine carboxypeptidase family protein [Ktedonobacterales bacterium]